MQHFIPEWAATYIVGMKLSATSVQIKFLKTVAVTEFPIKKPNVYRAKTPSFNLDSIRQLTCQPVFETRKRKPKTATKTYDHLREITCFGQQWTPTVEGFLILLYILQNSHCLHFGEREKNGGVASCVRSVRQRIRAIYIPFGGC